MGDFQNRFFCGFFCPVLLKKESILLPVLFSPDEKTVWRKKNRFFFLSGRKPRTRKKKKKKKKKKNKEKEEEEEEEEDVERKIW